MLVSSLSHFDPEAALGCESRHTRKRTHNADLETLSGPAPYWLNWLSSALASFKRGKSKPSVTNSQIGARNSRASA